MVVVLNVRVNTELQTQLTPCCVPCARQAFRMFPSEYRSLSSCVARPAQDAFRTRLAQGVITAASTHGRANAQQSDVSEP
jgi:hypothetical protein